VRLPELGRFRPELEVYLQRAPLVDLLINSSYCCSILHTRFGLPIPEPLRYGFRDTYLSARDFRRSGGQLIFSYERFPTRTPAPVVWQTGPTYTERLLAVGSNPRRIERQIRWKRACAAKSRLIVVPTQWGAARVAEMLGGFADKLRVVPFFLPHLSLVARETIAARAADPVRHLVFVGRQARRKGLDLAAAAFAQLNDRYPGKFRMTVVSSFNDGPVALERRPNLELIHELPVAGVQELLARAHFMVMPSRFETFGWVYVEAMARGAIPLALDSPVQAELLAGGRAGLLTEAAPEAIARAIEEVCNEPGGWHRRALAGYNFAATEYAPAAVAARMSDLFAEALQP
jgi:glycosyltransferase involved in cell wall biosynthesis